MGSRRLLRGFLVILLTYPPEAAAQVRTAAAALLEVVNMSTVVRMELIDAAACRQAVIPAFRALIEKGDGGELARLLRAAAATVLAGNSDRGPGFDKSQVIRALEGAGSVEDGIARSLDVLRAAEWARIAPEILTQDQALDAAEQLESKQATKDAKVTLARGAVIRGTVEAVCLPWGLGLPPQVSLTYSRVSVYLREHSDWLANMCSGAGLSGPPLELSTGESTQLFSAADLKRLQRELAALPEPTDPGVKQEFDHVRELIRLASKGERFALALTFT